MKIIIDSYYKGNKAKISGVIFDNYTDDEPIEVVSIIKTGGFGEYESGNSYKRELPGILDLLNNEEVKKYVIDTIIIDAHCILYDRKDEGYESVVSKLGLGSHLYIELGKKIPVIGVAKTNYGDNINSCQCLWRGESVRPLIITSCGMSESRAKELIKSMKGKFRIPDLIKLADRESKINFRRKLE